jgi:UDP-3-O-[3-hydroxymyristoyl] glucosamine N-acyltransferase
LASAPLVEGKNYLIVSNPLAAFQKIVKSVKECKASFIHKTASISDSVILEENVTVLANAVIDSGVRIGRESVISANVFIGEKCRIGNYVTIHPGAKILSGSIIGDHTIIHAGVIIGSEGFGYKVTDVGILKVPQIGIVHVGKDVEIGAGTCIDRGAFGETFIGDGTKIDNLVHIAHGVKIGSHCAILAQTAIAGSVKIGNGCLIGGQVAIRDHVKIGNGVKIVGKSAVSKDIKDGEIIAGMPAISFKEWKKLKVVERYLPEMVGFVKEMKNRLEFAKKSWWKRLLGIK